MTCISRLKFDIKKKHIWYVLYVKIYLSDFDIFNIMQESLRDKQYLLRSWPSY